jgi:hypothetical protein
MKGSGARCNSWEEAASGPGDTEKGDFVGIGGEKSGRNGRLRGEFEAAWWVFSCAIDNQWVGRCRARVQVVSIGATMDFAIVSNDLSQTNGMAWLSISAASS